MCPLLSKEYILLHQLLSFLERRESESLWGQEWKPLAFIFFQLSWSAASQSLCQPTNWVPLNQSISCGVIGREERSNIMGWGKGDGVILNFTKSIYVWGYSSGQRRLFLPLNYAFRFSLSTLQCNL